MKIRYDKDVDVMYIKLAKGKYSISKNITDSIIVDFTKDGKILGVEILDASENIQYFNPKKPIIDLKINDNKQPHHQQL